MSRIQAQEPGEQTAPPGGARGPFAGMQRTVGTVIAINGANLSVKAIENGETVTVVTTANTRVMREGATVPLGELKPGEGVIAAGQLDAPGKTLHAAMLMAMTPDQTAQMARTAAEMKVNLGKTYIVGRVTAIDLDALTMTVARPDGQSQTIGLDEGTSFKRGGRVEGIGGMGGGFGGRRGGVAPQSGSGGGGSGAAAGEGGGGTARPQPASGGPAAAHIVGGESITLADVKVGDTITGLGAVKNGTFVPGTLNVQVRNEGRRNGAGSRAPGNAASPTSGGPGL